MSDTRIFCSRKQIEVGQFTVYGDEAHHALRVKRHVAGDQLYIFTEQGSEFLCTITGVAKNRFTARIDEKLTNTIESLLEIHLIQGLPKAAKLEQILVHGTELGLTSLQPAYTQHSVAKGERLDRWRKLTLEAVKQSGRRVIPRIYPASNLSEIDLEQYAGALRLVAAEPPWSGSLRAALLSQPKSSSVVIAIGPEGGFSQEEIEWFGKHGFKTVSMGPRVLRTQTAPLALMAAIQWHLGDWEPVEEGE